MQDDSSTWVILYNAVVAVVAWALAYTGLPVEPAIVLALLMMIDFCFALIVCHHVGEPITSKKMKHGAITKMFYFSYPLFIAVAASAFKLDINIALMTGVMMLVLGELYSIGSHIIMFRYGYKMPEVDAFKLLVGAIGERVKKIARSIADE